MWGLNIWFGDAHADDGTDHGMGTGGWQPEPPRAQIPQNSGDQQRKDHGEAGPGADLKDKINRQQRDHRKCHRPRGGQHAGQVA